MHVSSYLIMAGLENWVVMYFCLEEESFRPWRGIFLPFPYFIIRPNIGYFICKHAGVGYISDGGGVIFFFLLFFFLQP